MQPSKPILSSGSPALSTRDALSLTLRVALEHHAQGRLQQAAALYREVQGIDPGNVDAVFLLGLVALARNDHNTAERLLTVAARRMPKAACTHRALGVVLARRGHAAQALQSYWRALALDPLNAASYVDVGEALIAMKPAGGNDLAAAACFARGLQLDGACAGAHAALGNILLRARKLEAAEAAYRRAVRSDASCASHHNSLGTALYRQGRHAAAADAYRQALQLQPRSAEIYLNLGQVLEELGNSQGAAECCRQALRLRPRYARALRQLARLESRYNSD